MKERISSRTDHVMVLRQGCPDVNRPVWVDQGIAPLLESLWAYGFSTQFSCQGNPDDYWSDWAKQAYICFTHFDHGVKFLKVMADRLSWDDLAHSASRYSLEPASRDRGCVRFNSSLLPKTIEICTTLNVNLGCGSDICPWMKPWIILTPKQARRAQNSVLPTSLNPHHYQKRTTMSDLLHIPDWPMLDDELMSNFDHEVNQQMAQRLRHDQVTARYPAWNFFAHCWFADDQFHAAVLVYHEHVGSFSADTPEELMKAVSDAYGWD